MNDSADRLAIPPAQRPKAGLRKRLWLAGGGVGLFLLEYTLGNRSRPPGAEHGEPAVAADKES